MVAQWWVGIL